MKTTTHTFSLIILKKNLCRFYHRTTISLKMSLLAISFVCTGADKDEGFKCEVF